MQREEPAEYDRISAEAGKTLNGKGLLWKVEKDGKGYIEDRRPNANVDPYVVTRLLVDTCCSALEKAGQV